mmetsp:Transcript_14796/g.60469  ORF Transcript_14796/g.60469 Transcript_14796/m.60469 type:complete len:294 (+) Transcript_14796:77-958(+)
MRSRRAHRRGRVRRLAGLCRRRRRRRGRRRRIELDVQDVLEGLARRARVRRAGRRLGLPGRRLRRGWIRRVHRRSTPATRRRLWVFAGLGDGPGRSRRLWRRRRADARRLVRRGALRDAPRVEWRRRGWGGRKNIVNRKQRGARRRRRGGSGRGCAVPRRVRSRGADALGPPRDGRSGGSPAPRASHGRVRRDDPRRTPGRARGVRPSLVQGGDDRARRRSPRRLGERDDGGIRGRRRFRGLCRIRPRVRGGALRAPRGTPARGGRGDRLGQSPRLFADAFTDANHPNAETQR